MEAARTTGICQIKSLPWLLLLASILVLLFKASVNRQWFTIIRCLYLILGIANGFCCSCVSWECFFVQVMKNSFGLVEVADSKIVLGRDVSLVVGLVPFCL
jgi:hypothetical protein